jgi:hypothetical protein
MSDFSLMDAIECGIVKLPRAPVAENIPGNEMPMYRDCLHAIAPTPALSAAYNSIRSVEPEVNTRSNSRSRAPTGTRGRPWAIAYLRYARSVTFPNHTLDFSSIHQSVHSGQFSMRISQAYEEAFKDASRVSPVIERSSMRGKFDALIPPSSDATLCALENVHNLFAMLRLCDLAAVKAHRKLATFADEQFATVIHTNPPHSFTIVEHLGERGPYSTSSTPVNPVKCPKRSQ